MKRTLLISVLSLFLSMLHAQSIECDNPLITKAYKLAVQTVQNNTRDGILAAGADYGGEWTRDISINSWNGVSLMMPSVAEASLWSVTLNHDTIGHQYWDKILWVVAAYNHYLVTGNESFLKQAYLCSSNTMKQLEGSVFDAETGLFTGPSVFNDGIAGYPPPIHDLRIESSFVLDHPLSKNIKCLSTNCVYYGAYKALEQMAELVMKPEEAKVLSKKASNLKKSILARLWDQKQNRFNYFIDGAGKPDPSQEGLGISFAVIFGIIDGERASKLIGDAHVSQFGIPSVYPDFPIYSTEKPGRHNNIIWPMVNGFFARAAINTGNEAVFNRELFNLAHLAMDPDKGNQDFREIYNPYSGIPDGGWQLGSHWNSCHHQTWSATAFINMVQYGIAGLRITNEGLSFKPYLPEGISSLTLSGLKYRHSELNVTLSGKGSKIKSMFLDGKIQAGNNIPQGLEGKHEIKIIVE
ncbi:MAG: hypothetical protein IPH88_11330 [Bacteroidales bacterium]|nr:hypothetical protein [Bacteroidales bacterium]